MEAMAAIIHDSHANTQNMPPTNTRNLVAFVEANTFAVGRLMCCL